MEDLDGKEKREFLMRLRTVPCNAATLDTHPGPNTPDWSEMFI